LKLFKFGHHEKSDDELRLDTDRARALSTGPLQSQEEQDQVRSTMEAELDAARTKRQAQA
jgi:hypothetical protein